MEFDDVAADACCVARPSAGTCSGEHTVQSFDEFGGLLRRGADLGGSRRLRRKADERKQ